MTCICAVVHSDRKTITFGADSAGSSDYAIMTNSSKKIFKKNNLLFGVAGSWRHMQLLHHSLIVPDRLLSISDEEYIALHVIDAIRSCFQEKGAAKYESNQEFSSCAILLGYNGVLYRLNQDYGAIITTSYDAIGSGDDVAKGALFATKHLSPIERISIALHSATEHTAFVRGPYVFETLAPDDECHSEQLGFLKSARSMLTVKRYDLGDLGERFQRIGEQKNGTESVS